MREEKRKFRDRIRLELAKTGAIKLADNLNVSHSNVLRWSDGVNLPHPIIMKSIVEFLDNQGEAV